jgi:hypothetical protein
MKYLSDYTEQAQTLTFERHGAFFAFGQKQFNEKRREGVKYVNMGAGLLCPDENVAQLIEELDAVYKDAIRLDVSENGAEKIIEREYFNHETQLTGDKTAMLDSLVLHIEQFPELFTDEAIKLVSRKCHALAVENDWF